jgi:nicotinate-nucleotide adenylyltransferase
MKVGLFGGTFNPFHNGHIRIIEHVRDTLGFDKIFLVPSATPPHKPDLNLAPAQDRYAMVEGSIKNRQGLIVSDKEIIRGGASFTIDTIRMFKEELDSKADIFFLMGSDAFLDIDTWKQKDRIFHEVKVVIMLRWPSQTGRDLASFIREHISKSYQYQVPDQNKGQNQPPDQAPNLPQTQSFIHQSKQTIYICKVPRIDISSTLIRERVKQGKSVEDLVPPNVLTIIQSKGLYK